MKIVVHTQTKRINYVNNFLVHVLVKNGVSKNSIIIEKDKNGEDGCLISYIKSFDKLRENKGFTWHLQDDVLPCYNFFERISEFENINPYDVICGFGNKEFYKKEDARLVHSGTDMFYSFPCIGIKNELLNSFLIWFTLNYDKYYDDYISKNKFIDYLFKLFLDEEINVNILNLYPCLVEHVDEYVGGSTIMSLRKKPAKALYFDDPNKIQMRKLKRWWIENANRK